MTDHTQWAEEAAMRLRKSENNPNRVGRGTSVTINTTKQGFVTLVFTWEEIAIQSDKQLAELIRTRIKDRTQHSERQPNDGSGETR